jgi:nitrite reductase/ring-hydroxylating ferredoxin subunit
MGAESVILARDKKKKVHVFLNSCRHRGMKVCQYDHGNTQLFTCPYHSWSYTTDGKLFGVPQFKNLYEGCLDKDEWSLIEVPKKLSKRQQELLRELAELDEKNITPERKGFMDRIMEYFQLQGTKE